MHKFSDNFILQDWCAYLVRISLANVKLALKLDSYHVPVEGPGLKLQLEVNLNLNRTRNEDRAHWQSLCRHSRLAEPGPEPPSQSASQSPG